MAAAGKECSKRAPLGCLRRCRRRRLAAMQKRRLAIGPANAYIPGRLQALFQAWRGAFAERSRRLSRTGPALNQDQAWGRTMSEIVIAGAARTPVGAFNGALSSVPAHYLGQVAIQAALQRAEVEPGEVSEVIMGQILTAGQGQNPARQASINAGLPVEVPAWGVNQLCGSGLRTVALGYQAIRQGDSTIVVAGGQES